MISVIFSSAIELPNIIFINLIMSIIYQSRYFEIFTIESLYNE